MKNKILLSVAFVACFGIGFVCGMYAQSQIIAGQAAQRRAEMLAFFAQKGDAESVVKCLDGTMPDKYGCCTDEVYTDLGDNGFACCPTSGGDCFPPIY